MKWETSYSFSKPPEKAYIYIYGGPSQTIDPLNLIKLLIIGPIVKKLRPNQILEKNYISILKVESCLFFI